MIHLAGKCFLFLLEERQLFSVTTFCDSYLWELPRLSLLRATPVEGGSRITYDTSGKTALQTIFIQKTFQARYSNRNLSLNRTVCVSFRYDG